MEYLTGPLIAFIGIAALVICTPGPDTNRHDHPQCPAGRPFGRPGDRTRRLYRPRPIWALATSAGLVALLIASEPLFLAVKMSGAAYLIWLGVQSLRAAFGPGGLQQAIAEPTAHRLPPRQAYMQGVVSDLSNPKIAAFFSSCCRNSRRLAQRISSAWQHWACCSAQ